MTSVFQFGQQKEVKKPLISIGINVGTYAHFINKLVSMSTNGSTYTCLANVHMLVEAFKDSSFASVVNNADIVTPDGKPLCFGLQLIYGKRQERVCGMDLLPDLLKEASTKHLPVYFFGGTNEMLDKTKDYVSVNYPMLEVAGMYSPDLIKLDDYQPQNDADRINKSGAKMIFVVLGCPKQEKWMALMKGKINGCMIGIGGALPVMIGLQKRAPAWMQKYYLEWLYRLVQEPKRLFKRYAVTNSIFVWQLLKLWIKQGFKPVKSSERIHTVNQNF